jgi:hypothetical protein
MIPDSNLPTPLDPQAVASGSDALESAASEISQGTQGIAQGGVDAIKSYSVNLLNNQLLNYQQTINKARNSVIQDPSPTNVDAQTKLVDNVSQQSINMPGLLPSERRMMNTTVNSLGYRFSSLADRGAIKYTNRQNASSWLTSYPAAIKAIAVNATDPSVSSEQHQQAIDDQVNNAKNLLSQGAITPQQYSKFTAQINLVADNHNYVAQNGINNHVDNNIQAALGLTGTTQSQPNPTVQAGQQQMQSFLGVQSVKQSLLSSTDTSSVMTQATASPNISTKDIMYIGQWNQGVQQVKAQDTSWSALNFIKTNLGGGNKILTAAQEGQRDMANYQLNQIKTDFWGWYTNENPIGKQALLDHNQDLQNIQGNAVLTPEAKYEQMMQTQQAFDQHVISYAKVQGIPDQYVNLLNPQSNDYKTITQSFVAGNDPMLGVNTLKKYGTLYPYYLHSLPLTQQAMYSLALNSPAKDPSLLILGNQQGYGDVKGVDADESSQKIQKALMAEDAVTDYLKMTPAGMIQPTISGLIKAVKFAGIGAKISTQEAVSHVVSLLPNEYLTGSTQYDAYPTSDYTFMPSQFGQHMSDSDAYTVASYVKNQAYQNMINQFSHPSRGNTPSEKEVKNYAQALQDGSTPLTITNKPDGSVIAQDKYTGRVWYSSIYHDGLVRAAQLAKKPDTLTFTPAGPGQLNPYTPLTN